MTTKINYEQRLRQRAKEFAKEYWNNSDQYTWDEVTDAAKQIWINRMLPLAELSITREGDAYDAGWASILCDGAINTVGIEQRKLDLGLIKPTTDE